MLALNGLDNSESHEFVQERYLVAQEFNEFVRIANPLARRHVRRGLHALIEGFEALIALAAPQLGKAHFDGVGVVLVVVREAALKIGNSEDTLKGRVDPTRSTNVAKSEHLYLWKAEKSVRKGTGSVFEERLDMSKVWATRKGSGIRSMSPGVLE
jgi:hypothetical protein